MTLSEALGKGLEVTATGLVIVFAVLIILMLVMMLMKVVFYHPETETKKADNQAVTAPAPAAPKQEVMNDDELIAVLTAAVAASLNTSTYHLNIKSYRRIENNSPAWNKAGLRDVIDARF